VPRGDVNLGIFGVRHHGPGSARSVVRALEAFAPEIVLVEGPPEADDIIALARETSMQPPIAILAYATETPKRASFYPFATFSPEWQAIQYALARDVPVRFIDLAIAHALADETDEESGAERHDVIGEIAKRAGYVDGERWWDRFVERRRDEGDAFAALEELMGVMRAQREPYEDTREERREAAMRQGIRAAQREFARVAVVCGAWHAPALRREISAAADARTLRGLPKTKIATTWIPWTHGRLARASGYGAGIVSPGWYEHLWAVPHDRIVTTWMAKAARTLRESGLDIASAHAIEATRLAEALAALREAPIPSLDDLTDAVGCVYCFGETAPLALLHEKLIVGERLGIVPENVTKIPLLADLAREQKRLRMAAEPETRDYELDVRKPNDLERSRLLHRMQILGVPWGRFVDGRRGAGTFRERWQLRWMPEFAIALIESSVYGNTVVDAAESAVRERAAQSNDVAELAALLDAALLANLTAALEAVLVRVRDVAAQTHDVVLLMDAIPSLANVSRYGDVRGTDAQGARAVLESLIVRACIGLPSASLALDDDAAEAMFARIVAVDMAVRTLDRANERDLWNGALQALASNDRAHGLVSGRATRALFDAGVLDAQEVRTRLGLALGTAIDPAQAAAWIDGAFRKSGLILVHQTSLLDALDAWLSSLGADAFLVTLPLIRRTFGTFASPERRSIGAYVVSSSSASPSPGRVAASNMMNAEPEIDWDRARALFPALREILGRAERAT
jgi:hypothetical protein